MEIQNIITLINAVSTADIMNFQMEEGNFKLTIDKVNARIEASVPVLATPVVSTQAFVQEIQKVHSNEKTEAIKKEVASESTKVNVSEENIKILKSPIVGTFYAASGPDQDDFAKVGNQVKVGQTLCIIEAMKLMNDIESEFEGEIVEILVKNEQMVEYNQPLFKIKVK